MNQVPEPEEHRNKADPGCTFIELANARGHWTSHHTRLSYRVAKGLLGKWLPTIEQHVSLKAAIDERVFLAGSLSSRWSGGAQNLCGRAQGALRVDSQAGAGSRGGSGRSGSAGQAVCDGAAGESEMIPSLVFSRKGNGCGY